MTDLQDHAHSLVLVEDGDAEGRALVGHALFPRHREGARAERGDAVAPVLVLAAEGAAGAVLVACRGAWSVEWGEGGGGAAVRSVDLDRSIEKKEGQHAPVLSKRM